MASLVGYLDLRNRGETKYIAVVSERNTKRGFKTSSTHEWSRGEDRNGHYHYGEGDV